MKTILKISRYLIIAIVVGLTLLIGLSVLLQSRITQIFRNEINRYTATGVDVEKVSFSLLKGFPKATVEFKNIRIESPTENNISTDSISINNIFLEAENIYASFNIRNIIDKKYSIEKLTVKNGSFMLVKDSLGLTIKRLIKEEYRNDSSKISFDLEDIRLDNTKFIYLDGDRGFIFDTYILNAAGKLSLSDDITSLELKSNFNINNLTLKNKAILTQGLNGDIEGSLLISQDSVNFRQIQLVANNQKFSIEGHLGRADNRLNLNLVSDNTDPGAIINSFSLQKDFGLDIILNNQNTDLSIDFDEPAKSFKARMNSFRTTYAESEFSGSFYINNLQKPEIDLRINAAIDLGQLLRTHPLKGLKTISGEAHLNARLKGRPGRLKTLELNRLLELDRSINIHLNNVDINHLGYDIPIYNITGNIMIADNLWADELSFLISGQNMVMNCKIDNAVNIFNKDGEIIDVTAGIWADKINTGLLVKGGNGKPEAGDRKQETGNRKQETGNRGQAIINRLSTSMSISADSLIIGPFSCSQFDGVINYKPGFLNISSFDLMALDGSFSGNTSIVRKSDGTFAARAWFDIVSADIKKAFIVFNNFGQDQIVAENIGGDLSGTFSISTLTDINFKPITSSLSVSGNYSLSNGELLNFEPALKLSRFIEVSELEDIKFQNLKNDIIIADRRLLIPLMEINSSAFNISLSGEQDFSGSFEYHLSVLLSDVLSRKARNSGSYISEFGPVQDDGLGRTTLFLKLEREGGETKASYDVKKLSEEIKVSLKKEKQSLKTILNEEYGWYKEDSVAIKENNSKRFRISWEESDSIKTVQEYPQKKQPGGIFRKIFKPDTLKKKF